METVTISCGVKVLFHLYIEVMNLPRLSRASFSGKNAFLLIIIPVRTADSMAVSANRKSQCKVVIKWQFVHELNLRDGFVCFVSPFLSLLYLSNLSYSSKAPFFYHPLFLPRGIIIVQNYHLLSPSFSLNAQTQL